MQTENCNLNQPESNLNVVLNDGTRHTFPMSVVDVVFVSQIAYLFDRHESAPACGEHTAETLGHLCPAPCVPHADAIAPTHEGVDSVQQTRLTDFADEDEWTCPHCEGPDQPGFDLHRKCGDYAQEAQESTRTSLVGINPGRGNNGTFSHCSRCRSPHRRAHIKRVAHNGHVTRRCFDCQNTGNEKAANLKEVRLALFNAQDRFVGGSLIRRQDILGVLYWTEARLNEAKASSSVRLTTLRAVAKSYSIMLEEVER